MIVTLLPSVITVTDEAFLSTPHDFEMLKVDELDIDSEDVIAFAQVAT
jgi:hypothetical protein